MAQKNGSLDLLFYGAIAKYLGRNAYFYALATGWRKMVRSLSGATFRKSLRYISWCLLVIFRLLAGIKSWCMLPSTPASASNEPMCRVCTHVPSCNVSSRTLLRLAGVSFCATLATAALNMSAVIQSGCIIIRVKSHCDLSRAVVKVDMSFAHHKPSSGITV